jgi:hypothetical protein
MNMKEENLHPIVSQLEITIPNQIQLPTFLIGENMSNLILMPSENPCKPKNETPSVNTSSNLKSNVKPHEILEKPQIEPRLLKVSKEDLAALCQVINEFKEQFINY